MGHEAIRFNAKAYIDVMYIDGRTVLHIFDNRTRFSEDQFLPKMPTEAVWEAIVICWSSVHTGLPNTIMIDEGSQFRNVFAVLSLLHDCNHVKSGMKSHISLGDGERYYKSLYDAYRKRKIDHFKMRLQLLLALATIH